MGIKWGFNCDIENDDLKSLVNIEAVDCGHYCLNDTDCTHFVWTGFYAGTCVMKKISDVTTNDAIESSIPRIVCGIVPT